MKHGEPSSVETEAKALDEQEDSQSVGDEELAALVKDEDGDKTPLPRAPTAAPPLRDLRKRYKYNIFCRLLFL